MAQHKRNDDPYRAGLAHQAAGRHAAAISAFEAALAARPDDARILFALANAAQAVGHDGAAELFFRRVLAEEPDRLEALVNLSNLLRANGRAADAIALLKPAIERRPGEAALWLTLGSALREAGDFTTAEIFYREALRLSPDYPAALGNLADLVADRGATDEALALYERALALAPDNAQVRLNRAFLLLRQGNCSEGWAEYEHRLAVKQRIIHADHGLPPWDGKTIARLLVTAEQGIGDQIMFASLVPLLADRFPGTEIVLEAEPRLVPLFARSFPEIEVRPSHFETRGGAVHGSYDGLRDWEGGKTIAIGSLPRFLSRESHDLPRPHAYLRPAAEECARWAEWLTSQGVGPFIGLCWRSGNVAGLRAIQYAPLAAWAAFAKPLPGMLVSLQYDVRPDEIAELERLTGRTILVPPALDQKQELDRTSAMIASLDAVVSAPTAVSWLSAGAGTPTFKILYQDSWTSLGNAYEPFAPACRCIMPERAGDWTQALTQAAAAIASRWRS